MTTKRLRVSRQVMRGERPHLLLLLASLFWTQLLVPSEAQFDVSSWTEWSSWSDCPSTCGPGIQTRERECRLDSVAGGSGPMMPCRGVKTQRKACQKLPCPTSRRTAHEVACSRYNSRVFSGRRYVWEPFTHSPSPCKLACRARGQHFYANLGGRVQDGTSCGQGRTEAICDAGVCKKTGCDGIIGSSLTRDNCGVCQGDGSSCNTISGIFTSTSLRRGLNDVISIPEGSTNINITELEPSRNLLLLQTFQGRTILTGGSRSPVSGEVAAAGTVFTYSTQTRSSRRSSIFSPGPTDVGVKLKLLLRDRNPGIMYTFNVRADKEVDSRVPVRLESSPVIDHTGDDALRERMGVSGLEAGPEPEYPSRPVPRLVASGGLEESTSGSQDKDFGSSEESDDDVSSEESDEDFSSEESSTDDDDDDVADSDIDGADSKTESSDDDDPEESERRSGSHEKNGDVDGDIGEEGGDPIIVNNVDVDAGEERDTSEEDFVMKEGEKSLGDEDVIEEKEDDDDEEESDEEDEDDDKDLSEEIEDETDSELDDNSEEIAAETGEYESDDDKENGTERSTAEGRRDHLSHTQSDERAGSDLDEDYRVPKYSQSFSFGKRYYNNQLDDSSRGAAQHRSHSNVVGGTQQSGRVVRFGLKYVDDDSDNEQTVTVGSSRYVPGRDNTRGTYNRAYLTTSQSGRNRAGSNRGSYQSATKFYAKPYKTTQSQPSSSGPSTRREDLLRRQRQREAAREERRRQELERYHRRLREQQDLNRHRQAQLAERRRLQRERYTAQDYGTAAQPTPGSSYSGYALPETRPGPRYKDTVENRKQSTRGPVIRHYGEDGLYASGQKVRGTQEPPESVEIFGKPEDKVSVADSTQSLESKSPKSSYRGNSPPTQPRIIPRVRSTELQDDLDTVSRESGQPVQSGQPVLIPRVAQGGIQPNQAIISNVAKPVEQARPNIIPRIRTPDLFDNTGGRRPSLISALSGGDVPRQETREILPNSSPVRPVDRASQAGPGSDDVAYAWKISGFTECTKTCGGGVQQTVVVCVDTTSQAVVTDENCRYVQRPDLTAVKCNTRMCPAEWSAGPWGACSASCGGGQRTRSLTCQARVSPTLNLTVDNSSCAHKPVPVDREECGLDPCNSWRSGNWSECSARCGEGEKTRPVECVSLSGQVLDDDACSRSIGKPRTRTGCDNGPCGKGWFYQNWPEECPVECGEGEITRKIFCSGDGDEVLPEERCDPDLRPEERRKCRSDTPCGGLWFTGPWSKCEAACGPGNRTRAVLCIKSLSGDIFAPVDPENCLVSEKPAHTEPCEQAPCTAQWYMTSWSQCSKSCGTGYRSRGVKCLNPDHTVSDQCSLAGRPKSRDACNTQSCSRITTNETTGPEPASGCRDQFVGCLVVRKARLCRYQFYREKCCQSCAQE